MSVVQRVTRRPVNQFPERNIKRVLQQSTGIFGQFGQGFDNGIHLDFVNDFHYVKALGQDPQIAPFKSLFTYTRASSDATFQNSAGLIQYANENVATRSTPTVAQLTFSANVSDNTTTDWTPVFAKNTQSITYGDNSLGRYAYTNSGLIGGIGIAVTYSVYIYMTTKPTMATAAVDAAGDFSFLLNGEYPDSHTAILGTRVEYIAPNIHRCSISVLQITGSGNYGVVKTTTHSSKTFVATGFQAQVGAIVGPYLATTGSAKYDQPRIEYSSTTLGTNWFKHSQDQSNAVWQNGQLTVSTDVATAPDGSLTADELIANGGNNVHTTFQTIAKPAQSTTYIYSVFLKASTGGVVTRIRLNIGSDSSFANGAEATMTFATGTITTAAALGGAGWSSPTATISDAGNGWYRFSLSATSDTLTAVYAGQYACSATSAVFNSDGSSFYAWGAQLEYGTLPTAYAATTSTVPAYKNSAPTPLGLLIEGARTNSCLQSQAFNTTWVLANATVTANADVAPDGTTSADRLISVGSIAVRAETTVTYTAAAWTASCFVKSGTSTACAIGIEISTGVYSRIMFNLLTGTVIGLVPSDTAATSSSITPYANGWYRCAMTVTPTAAALKAFVYVVTGTDVATSNAADTYISVWGGQVELGAFPTSHIPTHTAAVTRATESNVRTLGSEFSFTSGTIFANSIIVDQISTAVGGLVTFWDSTGFVNGAHSLYFGASATQTNGSTYNATVIQSNPVVNMTKGITVTQKDAYVYAANDFITVHNGTLSTPDVSGTIPASGINRVSIGRDTNNTLSPSLIYIKQVHYWPERKPNSQLQGLTT